MDIMSLMSLHLPSPHLPSLTSLLLLLVSEATLVVPLLILTEALKVFVARGPLKKLPLLKMTKFTEPDTTAMLDKPSGDSPRSRGLLKLNLKLMLIMVMEVTTATNSNGPVSVFPVSPPNVSAAVASGQLKLNLDTDIMDTPPTVDIMDTPMD